MTNFFKHAPQQQDTLQKRFLETVMQRRNLAASFPLGFFTVQAYSFAALVGPGGLSIVICPNRASIIRNMRFLEQAGCAFPEIAVLDGMQPPHEEREIFAQINHNRVRLLYTLPDRFASLTFLEMLVHANVKFLAIEQAELLLPDFPGRGYEKILETWNQLQLKPPVAILTHSLPRGSLERIIQLLRLEQCVLIQQPPDFEKTAMRVEMLFTERQKSRVLLDILSGYPGLGREGRLDVCGKVMIHTPYPAATERIALMLTEHGFDTVWAYHHRQDARQKAIIEGDFHTAPNCIIVSSSNETRSWSPPAASQGTVRPFRVIHWHPPGSVEELIGAMYRNAPGDASLTEGIYLYTREDFRTAMRKAEASAWRGRPAGVERTAALARLRRWVLSKHCRRQTLLAYFQETSVSQIAPCGVCDRCRPPKPPHPSSGFLARALGRWLY